MERYLEAIVLTERISAEDFAKLQEENWHKIEKARENYKKELEQLRIGYEKMKEKWGA